MREGPILILLLLIAIVLDRTLTSLPIFFALSIGVYLFFPFLSTIIIILVASLVFDAVVANPVGLTAIILSICFIIIHLWQKSAETKDYKIAFTTSLVITIIYANFFNYTSNLIVYLIIFLVAMGLISYFDRHNSRTSVTNK